LAHLHARTLIIPGTSFATGRRSKQGAPDPAGQRKGFLRKRKNVFDVFRLVDSLLTFFLRLQDIGDSYRLI
jgi:hypothetical protein